MKFAAAITTTALLTALTGCATTEPIQDNKYDRLVEGKTTYAQMINVLGQPTSKSMAGSDKIYTYTYKSSNPLLYIPLVSNTYELQVCDFKFGPNEVLKTKYCNTVKNTY